MRRLTFLGFIICAIATTAPAQEGGSIVGQVQGNTYIAPSGTYRIIIPVLEQLGGTISDTENVVVFQDQYNVHVSVGCFLQDATQRWELSTRGLKEYLTLFFSNYVLPDFQRMFAGARIESTVFDAKLMDGALIAYTLLPGGTMFAQRLAVVGGDAAAPVAKRGNLLFIRNGYIYVISVELTERVLEGTAYSRTTAEEDALLRRRLEDLMNAMQFTKPAAQ